MQVIISDYIKTMVRTKEDLEKQIRDTKNEIYKCDINPELKRPYGLRSYLIGLTDSLTILKKRFKDVGL